MKTDPPALPDEPPEQDALTLADIAAALAAPLEGDASLPITGVAEPGDAGPGDIVLALAPEYTEALAHGQARAAILWPGADWRALGLEGAIFMQRAGAALAGLTRLMDPGPDIAPGIHDSAVIDPTARIGAGAAIGPFAVIGPGVTIGARARIGAHVSIGQGSRIGDDALLHAGVRIAHAVTIGDRFIAHPNAVIGADGFSFKTIEGPSAVEKLRENVLEASGEAVQGSARWARVHSLGGVVIGDDVEIGASTTVDRGTIRPTRIGSGTKIDNQVQIAHNCDIGRDCLIAGATGIAGSVQIGDRVVLGGGCGVADNLFIGDDVVAGARTTVLTNIPGGRAIWGTPAVRMQTQIAINKELRRLPRLAARLRALEARLAGESPKNDVQDDG